MAIVALSDVLVLCPVDGCIRQLGTAKLMRAHLEDHAAGEIHGYMHDRHSCDRCGRWFKSAGSLSNHRRANKKCR
jgi:hypothetical protein